MGKRTAAGWHAYEDVAELLTELEITDEDMARAREITDDHIRLVTAFRVQFGLCAPCSRDRPGITETGV